MYQVNVVVEFPNPKPDSKPIQKNFSFKVDSYNINDGVSKQIMDEQIVGNGHDLDTVSRIMYDVSSVKNKKK